jgi:hypothetical protein
MPSTLGTAVESAGEFRLLAVSQPELLSPVKTATDDWRKDAFTRA